MHWAGRSNLTAILAACARKLAIPLLVVEVGIGLPIKINNVITVYGYGAYSYQWEGLVGTEPSTFWGGAKVTFSF